MVHWWWVRLSFKVLAMNNHSAGLSPCGKLSHNSSIHQTEKKNLQTPYTYSFCASSCDYHLIWILHITVLAPFINKTMWDLFAVLFILLVMILPHALVVLLVVFLVSNTPKFRELVFSCQKPFKSHWGFKIATVAFIFFFLGYGCLYLSNT